MDEVVIFANPLSGQGMGLVRARSLGEAVSAAGYPTRLVLRRAADEPARAELANARAVVSIGGDGTLREVAGWAMRVGEAAGTEPPPLLVVPMGTANLMVQHLDVTWQGAGDIPAFLAAVAARRIRRIDAATANGELALLVIGAGIDGMVIHELDRTRNGPISVFSYVAPLVQAAMGYSFPPITVSVDGQCVHENRPGMAFVGNIREYGTGFPILPLARSDDGLLDVCVLPCASVTELANLALHVASGDHLKVEGVVYLRGREIRVDSPARVPVQVDGEAAGYTPLEVKILPIRLPFIVPPAG